MVNWFVWDDVEFQIVLLKLKAIYTVDMGARETILIKTQFK